MCAGWMASGVSDSELQFEVKTYEFHGSQVDINAVLPYPAARFQGALQWCNLTASAS